MLRAAHGRPVGGGRPVSLSVSQRCLQSNIFDFYMCTLSITPGSGTPTTPGSEVPGSAGRPVRWQRFRRFQVPGSAPPESVGGG